MKVKRESLTKSSVLLCSFVQYDILCFMQSILRWLEQEFLISLGRAFHSFTYFKALDTVLQWWVYSV